jgi:hypothetical protein
MLGKLLKYEFKSTARILIPLYIAMILYSGVCRGFAELSKKLDILSTPAALMYGFYVILVIAVVVVTFAVVIQRFYKNLMGDEGYLMFTLPVETYKHIITKSLTAFVWTISSVIVALISIVILIVNSEIIEEIKFLLTQLPPDMIQTTVYSLILAVFAVISGIFMIYTAISIGQLVSGHKMVGSIVGYFGLYVVNQIIMTIVLVIFGYANKTTIFNDSVTVTGGMVLPLLIILSAVYLILSCVYFFVTEYIFKHKLNLE